MIIKLDGYYQIIMDNYRFKCRKCSQEFLRRLTKEDFEKDQYSANGHKCFSCGFPKMAVIKTNQMIKDGFTPGWQSNIRKHCNSYSEYKAELKKMGLIEIGYDELPDQEDSKTKYWTPDLLKKLHDMGIGFSGNELDAIEKGKLEGLY